VSATCELWNKENLLFIIIIIIIHFLYSLHNSHWLLLHSTWSESLHPALCTWSALYTWLAQSFTNTCTMSRCVLFAGLTLIQVVFIYWDILIYLKLSRAANCLFYRIYVCRETHWTTVSLNLWGQYEQIYFNLERYSLQFNSICLFSKNIHYKYSVITILL